MEKLRILIVDDDQDFAESMAEALELHEHEVQLAFSGEEAVSKHREHDFQISFMDVKLPGMNGVESFLEIHRLKPHAKVVMMTGYGVKQLLAQAVEKGAWAVLHKPIDMEQMFNMLRKIKLHGILIADDDPDFVASIRETLEMNGYTVFVARDGKTAVERVIH
jgi:DNA-binding NtrC family response regulator